MVSGSSPARKPSGSARAASSCAKSSSVAYRRPERPFVLVEQGALAGLAHAGEDNHGQVSEGG